MKGVLSFMLIALVFSCSKEKEPVIREEVAGMWTLERQEREIGVGIWVDDLLESCDKDNVFNFGAGVVTVSKGGTACSPESEHVGGNGSWSEAGGVVRIVWVSGWSSQAVGSIDYLVSWKNNRMLLEGAEGGVNVRRTFKDKR